MEKERRVPAGGWPGVWRKEKVRKGFLEVEVLHMETEESPKLIS